MIVFQNRNEKENLGVITIYIQLDTKQLVLENVNGTFPFVQTVSVCKCPPR